MKKIYLSDEAIEVIERLKISKSSEQKGRLAAIDPMTGEIYFGKSIAEAAKKGRLAKNVKKASFYYVKVGYESVYDLSQIKVKADKKQVAFPRKRKPKMKIKECKPCIGISPVFINKTIIKNKSISMVNFLI